MSQTPLSTDDMHHEGDWFDDSDGQVAIDVYQTDEAVILKAPLAGVAPSELEVSVTDEVVTIKGTRRDASALARDAYFLQECYWGSFVRSYVLPVAVDADQAQAILKDGMLSITIPKLERTKPRLIQVQAVN